MAYRPAWDAQLALHERVLNGELPDGAIMLVEHAPVITIGRRPGAEKHLLASQKLLESRGVEVVETDRGGDITFHGPGQLVAYPIIPLNRYNLNLHEYMRLIEQSVIDTLAHFGVHADRSPGATGVWVNGDDPRTNKPLDPLAAKVCAIGVKLRRWVTFHGLALNVATDLAYFNMINPCGLSRPVTSLQRLLGDEAPALEVVKPVLVNAFEKLLTLRQEHQSLADERREAEKQA